MQGSQHKFLMQYTKAFNIFTYINEKAKFYKISSVKEINTTCTIMNLL